MTMLGLVGGVWSLFSLNRPFVGGVFVFLIGLTMATWFVCAVPVSEVSKNACQARAEGFGLSESDWSFVSGCRFRLQTGQLVSESHIFITDEGEVLVRPEGG